MQFDSLAADLKSWLKESIDRGCTAEVIEQSMRAAGYQPKFARRAIGLAFGRYAGEADHAVEANAVEVMVPARTQAPLRTGLPAVAQPEVGPATDQAGDDPAAAAAAVPVPTHSSQILAVSPNAIETSDRTVNILFALNAPRVVLFGGLLSDEECDEIVRLSRGKLARSSVVNAATGAYDVHPDRTSEGTHFQRGENELIRRVERRISELISYPVENGEPIQILYYQPGAEYKPHFDFFDPALPGNDKVLAMGGQRVSTLVMYLNDVEAGGSTIFPEVGLDVLPRRGNAVYFAYTTPDGQLDRRTLHGGSPVTSGEKWIATKWLRQREYSGPSA
jgi:prolyl 4-hydroxylase